MNQPATETLYDRDFALWVDAQAAALRDKRFGELDLPNLTEEIEALAKRDRRELLSRLTVLEAHLLKLQYQPERASKSWLRSITEQVRQIQLILDDSPSLRRTIANDVGRAYVDARGLAAAETNVRLARFPEQADVEFERTVHAALAGQDFGGAEAVKRAHRTRARRRAP